MRIALFTDTYLPDINGVVSSTELLRKKLEERGHTTYVICSHKGLNTEREGNIIRLPGIEIKKLYGYSASAPIHYFLLDELKELNLDIIHIQTEFGVGMFGSLVAKHLNIPVVKTYHTTYEDYTHYINLINAKIVDDVGKVIVSRISKIYGNSCNRMIVPSQKTKNLLLSYGVSTPISIIPTGTELDRFNPERTSKETVREIRELCNIRDDEKMLLFVGRIAEEKSIDMIISTFVKVKEEGLKIKFVVVGGGPQLDELIATAEKLDVSDYCIFLGKKQFEEVPAFYHSADAFISASTSETQGMTYIEALASGLPVFARYDDVLAGIVEEHLNGYYFDNETELLCKIREYLNTDEDDLEMMKDHALYSVKDLDAETFVDRVIELYEDILDEEKNSLTVKNIVLKDDYVVLEIENRELTEKVMISVDSFFDRGLKKNSRISLSCYEVLKREENVLKAYRSCIRKLAVKDRSEKQIREHLTKNYELQSEAVEAIVNRLKSYNLIDDYRYANSRATSLEGMFLSKRHIINKLKSEGISDDAIEKCFEGKSDSELSKAKRLAEKYMRSIKGKSVFAKKQTILKKMIENGFSYETANEALSSLDFNDEVSGELEILKKEIDKAKIRYSRKYSGSDLRNRVLHSAVSKGFSIEKIYDVINEMEWDNE